MLGYWYGYGWWWWWIVFVVIFFLLPLGYGWGYRGWGPWYHRRRRRSTEHNIHRTGSEMPSGTEPPPPDYEDEFDTGWGWAGLLLWFVLIVAIIWLIVAFAWGGWWTGA